MFPALSYPVIRSLDVHDLDRLYAVYPEFAGDASDRAAIDFILRKVYGADLASLKTVPDLLQYLMMRHYSNREVPMVFDDYLLTQLTANSAFQSLPLRRIVPSRQEFIHFLAAAWPQYLASIGCLAPYTFAETGIIPVLPFDAPNVRSLLDNYFSEGILLPMTGIDPASVPVWARSGVAGDTPAARSERFMKRLDALCTHAVEAKSRGDWQAIGKLYGQTQDFFSVTRHCGTLSLRCSMAGGS